MISQSEIIGRGVAKRRWTRRLLCPVIAYVKIVPLERGVERQSENNNVRGSRCGKRYPG
jgi:hypothetical protein